MVALWLGGGCEFEMSPMTLQCECPVAVCVLQSVRTACPSSAGSKGTGACRGEPAAGLCQNAI